MCGAKGAPAKPRVPADSFGRTKLPNDQIDPWSVTCDLVGSIMFLQSSFQLNFHFSSYFNMMRLISAALRKRSVADCWADQFSFGVQRVWSISKSAFWVLAGENQFTEQGQFLSPTSTYTMLSCFSVWATESVWLRIGKRRGWFNYCCFHFIWYRMKIRQQ